jgi:hypothetical protein
MGTTFRFITFLSDYGLEDEFVGVCRGVIKRAAPDVEVIDIVHGISPQDVRSGAAALAQSLPYMPEAVHLAVVDPGVGTKRRAVVIETAAGSPLVGPDNGLLWLASTVLGGATAAHSIENREMFLEGPSRTFSGRDIFAPVAAALATGTSPAQVGPPVAIDDLVRLGLQVARVDDDHVHGVISLVDHFGNLQMNVTRLELEGVGVLLGDTIEVRVGGRSYQVPWGQAFSEVPAGRLILLEDSYRWITLAMNQGNARETLGAKRADPVTLARLQATREVL